MIDVLGIGAPIVDHILYVSEEALQQLSGHKGGMELVDFETFSKLLNRYQAHSQIIPGGSSANTIRSLAHLQNSCAFVGKVGNDLIGVQYGLELEKLNIKNHLLTSSTTTSQVLSFVTPDGERTCRTYLGASQEMGADDLNIDTFKNVKIVHIEGYTLDCPGLTEQAMEYAKGVKALVSFDLGNFEIVKRYHTLIEKLLSNYVDICFGNAEEVATLTGASGEAGCKSLQKLCSIAIVHNGKADSWLADGNTVVRSLSSPVNDPLDTTAAGDLYAAGFLHGYLKGFPLSTCGKYGAHLGAAAVQVQGSLLSEQQWKSIRLSL